MRWEQTIIPNLKAAVLVINTMRLLKKALKEAIWEVKAPRMETGQCILRGIAPLTKMRPEKGEANYTGPEAEANVSQARVYAVSCVWYGVASVVEAQERLGAGHPEAHNSTDKRRLLRRWGQLLA